MVKQVTSTSSERRGGIQDLEITEAALSLQTSVGDDVGIDESTNSATSLSGSVNSDYEFNQTTLHRIQSQTTSNNEKLPNVSKKRISIRLV